MPDSNECRAASGPEAYDLCALGLLEGAEAEEIEAHLARHCPTCIAGIRNSQRFWYAFGESQCMELAGSPRGAVRARLLKSIRREKNYLAWGFFPLTWPVATNATMAAGMLAVGWYAYTHGGTVQTPGGVATTSSIERLQDEIRTLQDRAAAAERAAARPPASAPPATVIREADPAVQQALDASRVQAQDTATRLGQEQARAQQLERDLTAASAQLDQARRALADAQRLADTLPAERQRVAERERQIATLTARVQQLEQDNTRYRETLVRLQRDLDVQLRMASFLGSPELQVVKLRGTQTGNQAIGHAFIVDGQRLVFYASNLPSLRPGRTYQLWVLRGRAPAIVSGGLFAGNVSPGSPLEFNNPSLLNNVRGLAVTDEPLGGSPGPTGNKFLVGTLRPL